MKKTISIIIASLLCSFVLFAEEINWRNYKFLDVNILKEQYIPLIKQAAANGDKEAEMALVYLYFIDLRNDTIDGIPAQDQAFAILNRLKDADYKPAVLSVGLSHLYGETCFYSTIEENGFTYNVFHYPIIPHTPDIIPYPLDIKKGEMMLKKIADDFPPAAFKLGRFYLEDEEHRNIKEGMRLVEMAGEKEDPDACQYLVEVYVGSRDLVEPDVDKAIYFAKKCAEKGDARIQTTLALIYDPSHDLRPDKQKYMYWMKKAANAGDRDAQFMYSFAVEEDPIQCMSWLQKSAENKNPRAMTVGLARLVNWEKYDEAIDWYQRWIDYVYYEPDKLVMKAFAAIAYVSLERYTDCLALLKDIYNAGLENLYNIGEEPLLNVVSAAIIYCMDCPNSTIIDRSFIGNNTDILLRYMRENNIVCSYYWSGVAEWFGAFGFKNAELAKNYMIKGAQKGDDNCMRFCIVQGWTYSN